MERGLEGAVEQVQKQNEAGLNYIYSKTYNFVYLRAKTILKNEEDVRKLMQQVYQQAFEFSDELMEDNVYEWLGKNTYEIGRRWYRKKKAREMQYLEMENSEMHSRKAEGTETAQKIICEALEQLPDLYHATVFAFYYDYMKVEDIAVIMDCTPGVIMNRLNYARKYIQKAIENYYEENKDSNVKITFSVNELCTALRKWSVDNCLGMAAAQNVYYNICKELKLQAGSIYLEGKEFAGVNNTIVYHKQDGLESICEEIQRYIKKESIDKKKLLLGVAIGAAVLVVVIVAAGLLRKSDKKEETQIPQNLQSDVQNKENLQSDTNVSQGQEEGNTNNNTEIPDNMVDVGDLEQDNQNSQVDSEYIFPNSNTEKLTREELLRHTKEELRLGRNEIYARHGMIFGEEELDNYFGSKSWYTPSVDIGEFYDKVEMSLVEEENINLIREVESGM